MTTTLRPSACLTALALLLASCGDRPLDPGEGTDIRIERYERTGVSAVYVERGPGRSRVLGWYDHVPWWSDHDEPVPGYRSERFDDYTGATHAAGWPMRSMSFDLIITDKWNKPALEISGGRRTELVWPVVAGSPTGSGALPGVLPTRPLWRGFAVNTLFYGALSWVLLFGWRLARRGLRAWRGRCPVCAYPRGACGTCSECGAALA